MRDLDLPRGEERELVVHRDRVHELNGEDSRTLAAVGAFRTRPDVEHDTLEHLHDEGLVETVDLGHDEPGLTLTRDPERGSLVRRAFEDLATGQTWRRPRVLMKEW